MHFDVIVVGGGPAGSSSAALFARQGRRVLLLDAARFPRSKPCAEYISPGGVAILERLGVLAHLERLGTGRYLRGMELVAPEGGRHLVTYLRSDGVAQHGLAVSRMILDACLLDAARSAGVEVRVGCRVAGVWCEAGRIKGVLATTGERLPADLVVGADGIHSVVARDVGARRRWTWPRRLGLVAHFEGIDWPENYGQMFVGRQGYIGVAPLDADGLVSVGFVQDVPRGRLGPPLAALERGLANFPQLAQRLHAGRRVGSVTGVGPLARHVARPAGPGFALVGDAAGFFDPFTGEGIFRALRSAELLTSNPDRYAVARRQHFAAKQRLVALIQLIVQTPRLMDFAVRRLQSRPRTAHRLGAMLGDLEPARLDVAWRLLGP
ncbi:MAG TPA: NAD(P)/FAD-dependent oxidoreductase [Chloroflexota bacterium]|jgi:flavin-dependent dehydrogenase|nr:NAD(P)/FAD-dependent oxidoreductase [Chloroflexota bacterium]